MKWHVECFEDHYKRMMKWHKYFAWFPVFCYKTRKAVWLEYVERHARSYSAYFGEFDFEYREIL